MSDLRNIFTSRDFVINSNIVKCISSIDITLEEFLLVLYFINISSLLNTNDIKEKLGFDDEKIFNTFTSLINKKYIEMVVTNNNGEVIEQIKLDPLYDRLALNKKTENVDSKDIYAMFESELGRTLSSFEYEMINKWIEKGVEEETIKNALKEAVLNNVRNFKYIDKIIYEWTKKGIKNKIKDDNKKDTHEDDILDFEWFDENE
ncbi:dNA replication protein DnaD [Clostridium sp. CAG:524]|nr:dNA replication protein DnaD [Clostridium sp. CAG:524]